MMGLHIHIGTVVLLLASIDTASGQMGGGPIRWQLHWTSQKAVATRHERAAQPHGEPSRPHMLTRRDASDDVGSEDGAGFPVNNDLPPPDQHESLPPLIPNEQPGMLASSATLTPKPTTDGNVSPAFCASSNFILLGVFVCHFVRQTM